MSFKTFGIITILFLSSFAIATESDVAETTTTEVVPEEVVEPESCDELLQKEIQSLLAQDYNGILEKQFNLTMLKLALKTVKGKHASLEEMIRAEVADLNKLHASNPATLDKLNSLYDQNASEDLKSVYARIGAMKSTINSKDYIAGKKIENDDVAAYILYDSLLNDAKSPFGKSDVAVSWLMKKMKTQVTGTNRAAISLSDQVVRYTGLVKGTEHKWTQKDVDRVSTAAGVLTLSPAVGFGLYQNLPSAKNQLEDKIAKAQNEIKLFFQDAEKLLAAKQPQCVVDNKWVSDCNKDLRSELPEMMLAMDQISAGVASNAAGVIKQKYTHQPKAAALGSSSLNQCGGKPFQPHDLSFSREENGVPVSGAVLKNLAKGNFKNLWNQGKEALHHLKHAASTGAGAARTLAKGGGLKAAGIGVGPVHCHGHFMLMTQRDQYEKEACCNNKPIVYKETKNLFGPEFTYECRGFYGIPHVAEVGIKGGVAIEGGIGGKSTLDEATCQPKNCTYGKLATRLFLALYAELLAGAAAVEGGVDWQPYVTAGYCQTGNQEAKFKVEFTPNSVYLYWQYTLLYGLKKGSDRAKIYESRAVHKLL